MERRIDGQSINSGDRVVCGDERASPHRQRSFQIQSPVTYSVTPSQPTYQFGQPVQLTLTATNPSNQSVAVGVNPASFTVTQGGDAIWTASASTTSQTFGTDTFARDSRSRKP